MADTTTKTKPTNEEMINQMYDAALTGQKTQLEQNYNKGLADLEAEQQKIQQQTDENLNRTYVEAAKAQKNWNEVQNAYGLTSGAMGQARLAQDNQLQADLTALRGAQATVDANIERERTTLSQEYMAAIAQAQADNDLQRAQALYDQAKADEADLLAKQTEAGKLLAAAGDYSILGNIYGLTPEQVALLNNGGKTTTGGGTTQTGGNGWFNPDGTLNEKAIADNYAAWERYCNANGLDPETGMPRGAKNTAVGSGFLNMGNTNLIITPEGKANLAAAIEGLANKGVDDPTSSEMLNILDTMYRNNELNSDEYMMLLRQYQ